MLRLVSELADAAFEGVESNLDVFELGLQRLHLLDQHVNLCDSFALITESGDDTLDVTIDASDLITDREIVFTHS